MTQQNDGTNGIGSDDVDQDGRPDPVASQAETGGSGGAGLTRHEGDGIDAGATAPGGSTQAHARGAFDTRADQAGAAETGLGDAESGANQDAGDLAPRARPAA